MGKTLSHEEKSMLRQWKRCVCIGQELYPFVIENYIHLYRYMLYLFLMKVSDQYDNIHIFNDYPNSLVLPITFFPKLIIHHVPVIYTYTYITI